MCSSRWVEMLVVATAAAAASAGAAAQTVLYACYVPNTGTVYRIKTANTRGGSRGRRCEARAARRQRERRFPPALTWRDGFRRRELLPLCSTASRTR
jgi:hypothetical protein